MDREETKVLVNRSLGKIGDLHVAVVEELLADDKENTG